ncbi:PREDICTED: uncharacterized protein LOC100639982 [Amphimedon queenslandica]|uniref:DUF4190 domain-containing protein n=2 Tax=Amphimedon queenslandica TaxID=400682 RepID=A0AAN0ICL8_AMPQE|nr:PREDICTED: uncharacterized protein LOC100639982 [Amphimedon queenslandica]|eukprot:XP_003385428.1 PREDICTED: uncharacterized protein LOC100639982 [Amphimedon queenslandica]
MASGYPPQNYQPPPPMGYAPAPQNFKNEVPPPYSVPPPQPQPGYGYAPAAPVPQQQSSNNVVVVNSQPTPAIVTTIRPVGDHFLTLSIVLTIVCFICGAWHALLCTIPAIIFSTMARDAEARGDMDSAQTNSRLSLGCNIGGIVSNVAGIVILIIVIAIEVSAASSAASSYYSYCYYYYSYTYDSYRYYCYK